MNRWALLASDGRVIQEDLRLRPEQAREHLRDVDELAPQNAPHFVALAGGEEA